MVLLRSLAYFVVFYVNTALFLVLGSWLLLAPRRWAMEGLKLHGRASLWLLKMICGTHLEVRGREKLPARRLPGCVQASIGLGYLRADPGVPRSRHGDEGGARNGFRSMAGSVTNSSTSSSGVTKAPAP